MSEQGIKTLVSPLQPISQQVGEHIITALKQPDTAAVLTSIVPGFPTDRLASIPLTTQQTLQIRALLEQQQLAIIEGEEEEQDRNIGFVINSDQDGND